MSIICIILLIVIFCTAFIMDVKNYSSTLFGIFLGVCVFAIISAFTYNIKPPIQPIDVYRDKTTLKITYIDGVATDSVVVWKEEAK